MSKEKKQKQKRSVPRKILNGFILFFAGIIFLLLLLIGFSQTSTFRSFLKDKVTSIVNGSLNGELHIGSIDGTIFTSLTLNDVALTTREDTLLATDKIQLKFNPTNLLAKEIYVRNIEINNADIRLKEFENGVWNLNHLLPPSEEEKPKQPGGKFSYKIILGSLDINNASFIRQSYENRGSDAYYDTLNMNDLRVTDLDLNAAGALDLQKSKVMLNLREFKANTNITALDIRKMNGLIEAEDNYASVQDFSFITDSTNFYMNFRVDSLNVFDMDSMAAWKDYPVDLEIDIDNFYFGNLAAMIKSTNMLHGRPQLYLDAEGTYGNLTVNLLRMEYLDTHIKLSGDVINLHKPKNLYFKAGINSSYINYSNITSLLPELELPEYPDLIISGLNVDYQGTPYKFNAALSGNLPRGRVSLTADMNLRSTPISYDVKFTTGRLNVNSFTEMNSLLNAKGRIKGKGVDPKTMNTSVQLSLDNSSFEGNTIDSLVIDAKADNSIINASINGMLNNAYAGIEGSLNLQNPSTPTYDLEGEINSLNISRFISDTTLSSDLNLDFYAKGENLAIDSITGKFEVELDSSTFKGQTIYGANIALELDVDSTYREILLTSDFIDFTIEGNFSLNKAMNLLTYEAQTISDIIARKADDLNPIKLEDDEEETVPPQPEIASVTTDTLEFDFNFQFKDLDLIALALGMERLDISGEGEGSVRNDSLNFAISSDIDIDYFIQGSDTSIIYVSDLQTNLNFSRNNQTLDFDNLFGALSVTGDRIYFGSNVENLEADLIFNQSQLFYNFRATLDTAITAALEGDLAVEPGKQNLTFDNLEIGYKNNTFANRNPIGVTITPDSIKLNDFRLYHDSAFVSVNGAINTQNNTQNINIATGNITGRLLNKLFLDLGADYPRMKIALNGDLTGSFDAPVMDLSFDVTNIAYGDVKLGQLNTDVHYSDQLLETDLRFIAPTDTGVNEYLSLVGSIPVNLAYTGVENRVPKNENLDIKLKSNEFKLSTLNGLIPLAKQQSGAFNANVNVSGTLDDPQYEGNISVDKGWAVLEPNNMDYFFNIDVGIETGEITLNQLEIKNTNKPEYQGTMTAGGSITLDGFELSEIDISVNGELSVLSEASRFASPTFYGPLFIGTDGDWKFTYRNGSPYFEGEVDILQAEVTYAPGPSSYTAQKDDFEYKYVVDSSKIDDESLRFNDIQKVDQGNKRQTVKEEESTFDYRLTLDIVNEATFMYIISKVANQKLTVEATGRLTMINVSQEQRVQGAFELMEGSRLQFFKTLEADGTITFESDITNPYLNITATYQNDHEASDGTGIEQVAVKIQLQGSLDEIGRKLANNPSQYISVYVGSNNIQNNNPSTQYDATDAMSFIITGKFKNELLARDRNDMRNQGIVQNAGYSLMGSVLTSLVNSAVGDVVSSVEVGQESYYGKEEMTVTVTGRYEKFRYSLGGSQRFFDDPLAAANLSVAYLFTQNFLIRYERKDPVIEAAVPGTEKINEVALQYRFEF